MITAEALKQANEHLNSIPFKGKGYVMVNERVKAFREICPSGKIETEIVNMADGIVTMKTTISDEDGKVLSTAFAQEKETSSPVNKTSFVENCETSAIGRALGFLSIGIDDSIASADELANALKNQNAIISEKDKKVLENLCAKKGLKADEFFTCWPKLTNEQYVIAVNKLSGMPDKK